LVDTLKGRKALVTGAASGIGRAILLAFREAGAQAVGLDRLASDGDSEWVLADLTHEGEIIRAVSQAGALLGGMDVLVNCAGIELDAPISAIDTEQLDYMFAVNIRAPFLVTREALKLIGPGGRIINIASELGFLGRAGASGYCATKGAILTATRSWARELAPDILVNAIAPGPVDTPLLGYDKMTDAQKLMETDNPMGRIGRPEEVAAAAVFLASSVASFTTGQCISVDGGAAMH